MLIKNISLLIFCLLVTGCTISRNIDMTPVGGSKSDGVVRFMYQHGSMVDPIVDFDRSGAIAAKKCKSWGYDYAELFGGGVSECVKSDAYGCSIYQVTVEYQCTSDKK